MGKIVNYHTVKNNYYTSSRVCSNLILTLFKWLTLSSVTCKSSDVFCNEKHMRLPFEPIKNKLIPQVKSIQTEF